MGIRRRGAGPQILKRRIVIAVDSPDQAFAGQFGASGISEEVTVIKAEMISGSAVGHLRVASNMVSDLTRVPKVHLLRKLEAVVFGAGHAVARIGVGGLDVDGEGQGFQD